MSGTAIMRFGRGAIILSGLIALVAVAGVVTVAGAPPPSSFQFSFDGRHVPATFPTNSGVMHVGTFTASAPFCTAGTVVDVAFDGSAAVRRSYTCADGSGSALVRSTIPSLEHMTGGRGSWSVLEGTGRYASLRGKGTWESVHLSGDPADFASVTFRSTSTGIADLDAVPPELVSSRASATKLRRPRGAYTVRANLSVRDNVDGNAISYRVVVSSAGVELARKAGTTTSGAASVALRIRPPTRARTLRLDIRLADPLDNERWFRRSLTMRR
jgi:hypothetical protein